MEGTQRLAVFFLIFSMSFNFFSYAFSFASNEDMANLKTALSIDELYRAGILLGEAQDKNITFATEYIYYETLNDTDMRVGWGLWGADNLRIGQRNTLFSIFQIGYPYVGFRDYGNSVQITNASIIERWNPDYNWSKFTLDNGFIFFIIDPDGENNITDAVYTDGVITGILAESADTYNQVSFDTFISWYASMITGANNYGLPDFLILLVQFMTVMGAATVIFLMKEFIPFLN